MKDKTEYPSYFGILPASVRYDKALSMSQRVLYSELTALSNKYGYSNAKNSYFANLYGVDKTTVSRWISTLEKAGHIKTTIIYKADSKQVEERKIYPLTQIHAPIDEKINTPIDEKRNTPIDEKLKDNNTSTNNTRKNRDTDLPQFLINQKALNSLAMASGGAGEALDFSKEADPIKALADKLEALKPQLGKYPAFGALGEAGKTEYLSNFAKDKALTHEWKNEKDLLSHLINLMKFHKPKLEEAKETRKPLAVFR
jgi:hypothetical protein